jgi:hypothetical protein
MPLRLTKKPSIWSQISSSILMMLSTRSSESETSVEFMSKGPIRDRPQGIPHELRAQKHRSQTLSFFPSSSFSTFSSWWAAQYVAPRLLEWILMPVATSPLDTTLKALCPHRFTISAGVLAVRSRPASMLREPFSQVACRCKGLLAS